MKYHELSAKVARYRVKRRKFIHLLTNIHVLRRNMIYGELNLSTISTIFQRKKNLGAAQSLRAIIEKCFDKLLLILKQNLG